MCEYPGASPAPAETPFSAKNRAMRHQGPWQGEAGGGRREEGEKGRRGEGEKREEAPEKRQEASMGEKRQPLAFLFPPGPRCQSLGLSRGFLVALLVAFSWRFSGGGPIRLARGEQRASSIEHRAWSSEQRASRRSREAPVEGSRNALPYCSVLRTSENSALCPLANSDISSGASRQLGEGRSAASRHLGISAAGGRGEWNGRMG